MNIELYQLNSPVNQVTKKVYAESLKFTDCILKHDTSITKPTIIINTNSYSNDIDVIRLYNYVKVPKLSRYYFIDDIIFLTGRRIEIRCSVDVLYSFKDDILSSKQLVSRSESNNNKYIVDSELPLHCDNLYIGTSFGESVTNEDTQRLVLKTMGKGVS